MALLIVANNPDDRAHATFLRDLALSDVAGEMAGLLREAFEIYTGSKPDAVAGAQIRAAADRLVRLQAPSAREHALTAANQALARMLDMIREETQRNYCDHSSSLLVEGALEQMQGMTQRIGAGYILSAFGRW